MKVTLLGTGTSQGVPVIACDCDVCTSNNFKDNRSRSSVMIQENGLTIVIDAGPDFRSQMLRENVRDVSAILLTHDHKDHMAGLDDIRPFNFAHNKAMEIYCEQYVKDSIKREFYYVFDEVKYPGIPEMNVNVIDNHLFTINTLTVIPIRVQHFKLPILGYRINDFVYITDASDINENELKKISGAKVLVINALRIKKHYSHFNLEEALNIIEMMKPEKAYITHISHMMGLHDTINKTLPSNVELAYDGLSFEIK